MKKNKTVLFWGIFLISIFSIIISMYYDYWSLNNKYTQTQATITDVEYIKNVDESYYDIEYRFYVDNKTYYGTYHSSNKYSIGDSLIINYNLNNPKRNFEKSVDNSIISSIVSIIFLAVLLIELDYVLKDLNKTKNNTIEENISAIKKAFKLITKIMLIISLVAILFIIYIINHKAMFSVWYFVCLSFLVMLIIFIANYKKNKAALKIENDSVLLKELKKYDAIECEDEYVYFTNKYLISIGYKLEIIDYKNILLMSKEEYESDGIYTYYVLLITKDYKKHKIGTIVYKNLNIREKIIEELKSRTSNVLEGYDKVNKEVIKQMKKNVKQKAKK